MKEENRTMKTLKLLKLTSALALLAAIVVGAVAFAGIRLATPSATYSTPLANCLANGTVNTTLPEGRYLVTVTDETTFLCVGDAGCAAGGHPFPPSLVMEQSFGVNGSITPISCRSGGGTGDFTFSLIAPGS